jgi:hypothetical protein
MRAAYLIPFALLLSVSSAQAQFLGMAPVDGTRVSATFQVYRQVPDSISSDEINSRIESTIKELYAVIERQCAIMQDELKGAACSLVQMNVNTSMNRVVNGGGKILTSTANAVFAIDDASPSMAPPVSKPAAPH